MTQNEIKTEEVINEKEENKSQLEIEEYVNTLKRLQADFENHIKRTEKEKEELTRYATHKFIIKLLKVIDDYDKALETTKKLDNEITKGLEMIHKQLHKLLEDEGITKIKAVNEKFDPYKHEVIDVTEGDEDNKIIEEIQKGYMIHDKVLRTSKVRISKNKEKK